MPEPLKILEASRLNDVSVIVGFSDGTAAIYTVEQLADLIPKREVLEEQRSETGKPFDGQPVNREA